MPIASPSVASVHPMIDPAALHLLSFSGFITSGVGAGRCGSGSSGGGSHDGLTSYGVKCVTGIRHRDWPTAYVLASLARSTSSMPNWLNRLAEAATPVVSTATSAELSGASPIMRITLALGDETHTPRVRS